ncbi:MAG: pentapeptide repeat-containing protein, partial [Thermodesulfobacteriota bacterium]
NLIDAVFIGTKLNEVDLSWANLSGANLKNADLTGANFTNADIKTTKNLKKALNADKAIGLERAAKKKGFFKKR